MTTPTPRPRAPLEAKAQAAGLSGAVAGIIIWALSTYVFKGSLNPGVVSLVYAAVPGALALLGAYLAPHTPRDVPGIPGIRPPGAPTGTVKVQPPQAGI